MQKTMSSIWLAGGKFRRPEMVSIFAALSLASAPQIEAAFSSLLRAASVRHPSTKKLLNWAVFRHPFQPGAGDAIFLVTTAAHRMVQPIIAFRPQTF